MCSGLVSWSAILWFDKNLCRYFIFLDLIKRRIIIVVGDGFEAAAMVIELVVIAYTTSTNLHQKTKTPLLINYLTNPLEWRQLSTKLGREKKTIQKEKTTQIVSKMETISKNVVVQQPLKVPFCLFNVKNVINIFKYCLKSWEDCRHWKNVKGRVFICLESWRDNWFIFYLLLEQTPS